MDIMPRQRCRDFLNSGSMAEVNQQDHPLAAWLKDFTAVAKDSVPAC